MSKSSAKATPQPLTTRQVAVLGTIAAGRKVPAPAEPGRTDHDPSSLLGRGLVRVAPRRGAKPPTLEVTRKGLAALRGATA